MPQTKKGNPWYFGMKAHIGVASKTKVIYSVAATAADSAVLPQLLRGEETRVWGDQAYQGPTETVHKYTPKAKDFTNRRYRHRGIVDALEQARNRIKSKVRAKVEHPIHVIKRVFGFVKVRYKGLAKNANRLFVACALANLYRVRRQLLRTQGAQVCPVNQKWAQGASLRRQNHPVSASLLDPDGQMRSSGRVAATCSGIP
jgi:IS5 family transposase